MGLHTQPEKTHLPDPGSGRCIWRVWVGAWGGSGWVLDLEELCLSWVDSESMQDELPVACCITLMLHWHVMRLMG